MPAQTSTCCLEACPELYLLPGCLSGPIPICPNVYGVAQAPVGAARAPAGATQGYRGEAPDDKELPVSGRAAREC